MGSPEFKLPSGHWWSEGVCAVCKCPLQNSVISEKMPETVWEFSVPAVLLTCVVLDPVMEVGGHQIV